MHSIKQVVQLALLLFIPYSTAKCFPNDTDEVAYITKFQMTQYSLRKVNEAFLSDLRFSKPVTVKKQHVQLSKLIASIIKQIPKCRCVIRIPPTLQVNIGDYNQVPAREILEQLGKDHDILFRTSPGIVLVEKIKVVPGRQETSDGIGRQGASGSENQERVKAVRVKGCQSQTEKIDSSLL